jgi:hypothetical protein
VGQVVYTVKDRKTSKVFPAVEWLATMCTHIPNRGEQMVRYYGYYSNVTRGKRQKEGSDDAVPCILACFFNTAFSYDAREIDRKDCALSLEALNINCTTMALYNAANNLQTETYSLFNCLGCKKRIEYFIFDRGVYTATGILDG